MLQSTARKALTTRSLPMSRAFLTSRQFQTFTRLSEKDEAFDPQKTQPEQQKEGAAEELNEQGVISNPTKISEDRADVK
jgi:hypothetical protein